MANKRKTIREAVKVMLDGQTNAGSNVYKNRVTNYWEPELPAINIIIKEEPVVPRDLSGKKKLRTANLHIEIRVEANDATDDTLDDIAEQIENIIEANSNLNGTASSAIQINTETELNSEGEKQLGMSTLSFEVKYTE